MAAEAKAAPAAITQVVPVSASALTAIAPTVREAPAAPAALASALTAIAPKVR